mmetsp:Transcript_24972/g.69402  ORF Transcript_24972/g.69402 Transcript_24972/m.69402 type:complete len:326 (+) Transcript_24972:484-1461(+)
MPSSHRKCWFIQAPGVFQLIPSLQILDGILELIPVLPQHVLRRDDDLMDRLRTGVHVVGCDDIFRVVRFHSFAIKLVGCDEMGKIRAEEGHLACHVVLVDHVAAMGYPDSTAAQPIQEDAPVHESVVRMRHERRVCEGKPSRWEQDSVRVRFGDVVHVDRAILHLGAGPFEVCVAFAKQLVLLDVEIRDVILDDLIAGILVFAVAVCGCGSWRVQCHGAIGVDIIQQLRRSVRFRGAARDESVNELTFLSDLSVGCVLVDGAYEIGCAQLWTILVVAEVGLTYRLPPQEVLLTRRAHDAPEETYLGLLAIDRDWVGECHRGQDRT